MCAGAPTWEAAEPAPGSTPPEGMPCPAHGASFQGGAAQAGTAFWKEGGPHSLTGRHTQRVRLFPMAWSHSWPAEGGGGSSEGLARHLPSVHQAQAGQGACYSISRGALLVQLFFCLDTWQPWSPPKLHGHVTVCVTLDEKKP